eukprot:COSAG01_NODE_367_length_18064_cov_23.990315_11_plen_252_part_00
MGSEHAKRTRQRRWIHHERKVWACRACVGGVDVGVQPGLVVRAQRARQRPPGAETQHPHRRCIATPPRQQWCPPITSSTISSSAAAAAAAACPHHLERELPAGYTEWKPHSAAASGQQPEAARRTGSSHPRACAGGCGGSTAQAPPPPACPCQRTASRADEYCVMPPGMPHSTPRVPMKAGHAAPHTARVKLTVHARRVDGLAASRQSTPQRAHERGIARRPRHRHPRRRHLRHPVFMAAGAMVVCGGGCA